MSIKVALEHRTTYDFDHPVRLGPHVVRLRPAPHSRTPVEAYTLDITPREHYLSWQQDPFGNWLARITFPEKTSRLQVAVGLVADLMTINPFDFFVETYAERFPFTYAEDPSGELAVDLAPYLRPVEDAASASAWLAELSPVPAGGIPTVQLIGDLNVAVANRIGYEVRLETGVQTPDETLARGIGSCRDSAWLLVGMLRELGLAARFVSGYLVQLAPDEVPLEGPVVTEDFTDLHAWAEVYLPGAGWVGLDATSGLFAGEGHLPLAATPHHRGAAPITGNTEPVTTEMSWVNEVRRVHEEPRTTRPYTDDQWARIDAVGEAVDQRLAAGDVRLTMGGEPTFVALGTEPEAASPQWQVAADGAEKREYAGRLAERLREAYAAGGVVHRGQGKWYPGEPLPRWNIALQWRTDGVPLWQDASLFDDPWAPRPPGVELVDTAGGSAPSEGAGGFETGARGAPSSTTGAAEALARPATEVDTPEVELVETPGGSAPSGGAGGFETGARGAPSSTTGAAEALARRIVRTLGLPESQLLAAYEDPLTDVAAQLRKPDGEPVVDEVATGSTTGLDVAALDAAVDTPTGWVVPLAPGEAWTSPAWRFRRGRLVLQPGTSAVGYRLPLDAISWTPPDWIGEPSYVEAGPPLDPAVPPVTVVDPKGQPTTALSVEARDDGEHGAHVFVFLPPTERLEDYCDLLKLVEVATRRVGARIVLEGYGPPPDPRLTNLSVTADPGVIEVNVHPTRSWADQRALTETLYEAARQTRLASEKFDLDGLHSGTGGGNHLTLGGATPAESPLLRRPDLLVSLLTHWQRHPALSYLFSGRFVGPTSQAPRFDEGRPEAVGEMEIAFQEVARVCAEQAAEDVAPLPWLVDRALRHLLTDLTGNTHRAEFCIDKLYSPDSSRGRLGLLELRGFEMPPHPQLAMVQILLVRALVARFWEEPLHAPLVRWGTRLHEDHLLPSRSRADMAEVVADLVAHGIDFEQTWLDPFWEFRFPLLGRTRVSTGSTSGRSISGGVEVELRQAIEPWHVLGEEATSGGTARYVDSSLNRLEVSVRGFDPHRHLITCQGVPVPLAPSAADGVGRTDDWSAGVRYRAWAPWSALHPSIGVHAPLRFDVVDVVSEVSLGGATYHVVHPGGRTYEDPPVNASEAEARRASRFEPHGPTPGHLDVAAMREAARRAASVDHPHTLDLRRTGPATVRGAAG